MPLSLDKAILSRFDPGSAKSQLNKVVRLRTAKNCLTHNSELRHSRFQRQNPQKKLPKTKFDGSCDPSWSSSLVRLASGIKVRETLLKCQPVCVHLCQHP